MCVSMSAASLLPINCQAHETKLTKASTGGEKIESTVTCIQENGVRRGKKVNKPRERLEDVADVADRDDDVVGLR